jgi:hypothetical protein
LQAKRKPAKPARIKAILNGSVKSSSGVIGFIVPNLTLLIAKPAGSAPTNEKSKPAMVAWCLVVDYKSKKFDGQVRYNLNCSMITKNLRFLELKNNSL